MLPAGQTEELGAPNSQNSESRVLDVFGPNFLIETNGAVGVGGQLKYQLYSVTNDGVVYQQALYDNGTSVIRAEKTLEIQTGVGGGSPENGTINIGTGTGTTKTAAITIGETTFCIDLQSLMKQPGQYRRSQHAT